MAESLSARRMAVLATFAFALLWGAAPAVAADRVVMGECFVNTG